LTTEQQRNDDCPVDLMLLKLATTPLLWFANQARGWHQWRRHVRVLVHRAFFLPGPPPPWYYFVKVTNLSPRREIEITHIWFDTNPRVDILNPVRPLSARLRLDETFETWVPVTEVPDVAHVERLVRVRLSSGKIVKSRLNKDVPPVGYVAGPGSQ
jgi:hypothetical protein